MNIQGLLSLILASVSCSAGAFAQGQPIGSWRAHMPYVEAISVATDGVTLFTATKQSFFTYNASQSEITPYSKVEGMADVGMAYVGYDPTTDFAILAYSNGNIDLFKDGTFFNIPDIKLKTLSGPKNINHIYTHNGLAYLSTSFGIVVINLDKKEIKETYSFITKNQTIEVKEMTGFGNYFYAVTTNGTYRINKNNPTIQAFSSWQQVDSRKSLSYIATAHNNLYLAGADSLFTLSSDTLSFLYKSPYEIKHLDSATDGLWIDEFTAVSYNAIMKLLSPAGQITDSFKGPRFVRKTVELSDKSVWVADEVEGLTRRSASNELTVFKPEGPSDVGSFDLLPFNGELWIAHGGFDENWTYVYNGSGLSHLKDGKWTAYSKKTFPLFNNRDVTDFVVLARDPVDGTIYAGSYRSGLFIIKPDGTTEYLKEGTILEPTYGDPNAYRIAGLTFDQDGNLWLNQAGAVNELAVRTREGNWFKYSGGGTFMYSAYMLTDEYNQKWYILPSGGAGVAVYNDNHTPDNKNDDVYAKISTSSINAFVNSIAIDKQGSIWFGTNDGIGILNCSPDQVASGSCEIERPIVQYDQFAGYLFQSEKVKTIAVDGANRKWIGTTNGVWLISPDGEKIVSRFTVENSPLPSNNIQKIAIDPVTGDVYIGTALGLVSYRGTATDGGESNQDVITFPNPVPSGYSGTIAIKGLSENADIRITDISGQLVYRTKALGGQAIWNGLDYTGRRPQSGVYLIFATNKDGTQTHAGKMVFME